MSNYPPPPGQPIGYATPNPIKGFNFSEFVQFRFMITLPIMIILFWILVGLYVLLGLGLAVLSLVQGQFVGVLLGLVLCVLGPILIRVSCEVLVVIFRMNETLSEIKTTLQSRP